MKDVIRAVEGVWLQLSYEERDNVILAQSIAKQELKELGICNSTITETLNVIALQLCTLILESRTAFEKREHCIVCKATGICEQVAVGEDMLTVDQYRDRVTFLLNESLENGLIQHLPVLELLYDNIDGGKLYAIECAIGDYIYLNKKEEANAKKDI